MYRISFMYPNTTGSKFNHDYYAQKHMPFVGERLKDHGLVRYEIDRGLAGGAPGSPAPFVATAHLYFNKLADFENGMKACGKELLGDVPNYTDLTPQVQISEIV
jgi:uncharacterized protein (TIGR02118 family)